MLSEGKIVASRLLVNAHDDAQDAKKPIWQFAVKLQRLLLAGVTESDLRWLISRRYAEQSLEVTRPGDIKRGFIAVAALTFADNSCFIITHAGLIFARQHGIDSGVTVAAPPITSTIRWDVSCRELEVNGKLAKRFFRVARAQWAILDVFQSSNWQRRAQIEYPVNGRRDPSHRLREVVGELNKGLDHSLIRFRMDGTGKSVIYDLT